MNPPVEPPTLTGMMAWDPPAIPVLPATALLAALWYILAIARLRAAGRHWPWWRSASFLTGCLTWAAVTGLAIERYGSALFSAFMFQQLTLSILVPPLLILGCPGRLLLRSTPHRGLGRWVLIAALGALRSRTARVMLHPGVTIPMFLFGYYCLYLSTLFDILASSWIGHTALEMYFLISGLLFIIPILSTDPLPVRQTNFGRLFDIFVEMPLHVFIGVILMMAPRPLISTFANPPPTWQVDPLADQAVAGALAWSYGEPVALAIAVIFAARWRRDEEKSAAATDTADTDAELAAYNTFLRRLAAGDEVGSMVQRQHQEDRPHSGPPTGGGWWAHRRGSGRRRASKRRGQVLSATPTKKVE